MYPTKSLTISKVSLLPLRWTSRWALENRPFGIPQETNSWMVMLGVIPAHSLSADRQDWFDMAASDHSKPNFLFEHVDMGRKII